MKTIKQLLPGTIALALCSLSVAYVTVPALGQLGGERTTQGTQDNIVQLSNVKSTFRGDPSSFFVDDRVASTDEDDDGYLSIDLSKTTGNFRGVSITRFNKTVVGKQYPIASGISASTINVTYNENLSNGQSVFCQGSGGYVVFDSIGGGVYKFRVVNALMGYGSNDFTLNYVGEAKDDSVPSPTATPTSKPTSTPAPTAKPTATPTSKPAPTATPRATPTATPLPGTANLSGRVTSFAPNSSGQIVEIGVANALVSRLSDRVVSVKTDTNGMFSMPGVVAGEYTIAAHTLSGYFSPLARRVPVAGNNVVALNFNTFAIGGKVTANGVALSGVSVLIAGRETVTTNTQGQWYYAGCQAGTFALSFQKTGYSFPTNTKVALASGAKYASVNVSATSRQTNSFDSEPSGGDS